MAREVPGGRNHVEMYRYAVDERDPGYPYGTSMTEMAIDHFNFFCYHLGTTAGWSRPI